VAVTRVTASAVAFVDPSSTTPSDRRPGKGGKRSGVAPCRYARPVPELSRFFGIVVTLNYDDHPPPHFHARYGGQDVAYDLTTMSVLAGRMSPRALGLVAEWARLHRNEILEEWERARRRLPVRRIEPLE